MCKCLIYIYIENIEKIENIRYFRYFRKYHNIFQPWTKQMSICTNEYRSGNVWIKKTREQQQCLYQLVCCHDWNWSRPAPTRQLILSLKSLSAFRSNLCNTAIKPNTQPILRFVNQSSLSKPRGQVFIIHKKNSTSTSNRQVQSYSSCRSCNC